MEQDTKDPQGFTTTDRPGPAPVDEGQELPPIPSPQVGAATPQPRDPDASPEQAVENRQAGAVEAFARDHEGLTGENERDALDWILGAKPPVQYDVPVTVKTETGESKVSFVIRQMDGRDLDKIETRHVNESTGRVDVIAAACDIVGEATVMLVSPTTGRQSKPSSAEFRTMQVLDTRTNETVDLVHPSAGEALAARFRLQLGVIQGVAQEVRRISGYDSEAVGTAKRRLVDASRS